MVNLLRPIICYALSNEKAMTKRLAVGIIALIAGFATATPAQEKQALKLVQTIPLPGVTGRLDQMGVDLETSVCLLPLWQTIPWKLWTSPPESDEESRRV
jgi:hypothetical protein